MLRMCGAFDDDDIMTAMPNGQFEAVNIADGILRQASTNKPVDSTLWRGAHMTPQDCIDAGLLTLEQLREYDCYAFFREPRSRFLSGMVHAVGRHSNPELVKMIMEDELPKLTGHPQQVKTLGLLTIKQANYFYAGGEIVTEALDFRNFQSELRRIIARAGGIDFPLIPRMNARNSWKNQHTPDDFFTQDLIDRFEAEYSEDYRMFAALDNWPPEPEPFELD